MIELSKLESHLWEAANILRGPVDAADFKTYISFTIFKRISDAYDEETETALAEVWRGLLILLSCLNSIASSYQEAAIGKMYGIGHPILVRPCIIL